MRQQPDGSPGRDAGHTPSGLLLVLVLATLSCGLLTPRTQPLAANTLLLAIGTAAVALPLSIGLAVLLFRVATPLRSVWIRLLAGLLFFPLYLHATGWNAGFGPLGWQTIWADRVGEPWLSGWKAAIWLHASAALPWATLIIGQSLRRSTPAEEAAALDTGARGVLWNVVLPNSGGAILAATLWIVATVSTEMTISDLFQIRTYAEELYTGFALEPSGAAVLGAVLPGALALGGLALAIALAIQAHTAQWQDRQTSLGSPRLLPCPWWAACLAPAIFAICYLLPVASLIWQAGVRRSGWSLAAASHQIATSFSLFHRELFWSVTIAALAATLSLLLATPLAIAATRRGRGRVAALSITAVGLATPGPLCALAVLWLLNRPGLALLNDRTVAAPVLAITLRCLPWALLILWHAFQTLPSTWIEAARVDGAGRLRAALRLWVPLRRESLGIAWLVCAALAIGDLAASILVMPPAVETAAIRLFGLIHAGVREQEAGLGIAILVVCGALAALTLTLTRFLRDGRRFD
ncbi:MAG: iron ABC transporter permease [Planctomycetales bacterium]|nr:iron ABC transporter permease [Planctomycetales bacterium]